MLLHMLNCSYREQKLWEQLYCAHHWKPLWIVINPRRVLNHHKYGEQCFSLSITCWNKVTEVCDTMNVKYCINNKCLHLLCSLWLGQKIYSHQQLVSTGLVKALKIYIHMESFTFLSLFQLSSLRTKLCRDETVPTVLLAWFAFFILCHLESSIPFSFFALLINLSAVKTTKMPTTTNTKRKIPQKTNLRIPNHSSNPR